MQGWLRLRLSLLAFFALVSLGSFAQQVLWAKLFPLPKYDDIKCITRDEEGNLYAGGWTRRNLVVNENGNAIIYKLDSNGDTLYTKFMGMAGEVGSILVDPEGVIRIAVLAQGPTNLQSNIRLLYMTPEGFVFKTDTIFKYMYINASMMGKDSSWIIVGQKQNDTNSNWSDMYFQRIHKDGTIDPYVSLNPGHPSCAAHRVEQLPNGNYLVSGSVGSRIATFELNEWGLFPVFRQWYQTPDLSFLYSGHVSRISGQRYMIGAEGGPSIVGQYDSLLNKYWLRKDIGTQVPPQANIDGSIIFGYVTSVGTNNTLFRVRSDSSEMWKIVLKDSLAARGINGVMQVKIFSYFDDESAVAAGVMYNGSLNREDPIFLRIANVGTPVTSLSKPKPGSLKNETLAPWPNPTGGSLYLKQHFDKAEVRLYNLAGREVGNYNIRFGQPIELAGLSPGLYLYRAVIDGKAYSGKVVKR